MENGQMPDTPKAYLHSQIMQENADPEAAILARVYALILTWSQETKTGSEQNMKANASQPGTGGDHQQDNTTESSTLKTE